MTTTTVTTSAELSAAVLKAQANDLILVAPGKYGPLTIANRDFGAGITIEARDPATPPQIAGIEINKAFGVTLRSLDKTVNEARWQQCVYIIGSGRILVENGLMRDIAGTATMKRTALTVRQSDQVVVQDEVVSNTAGMRLNDSTNVTFDANDIDHCYGDGIQGWQCSNVVIKENIFGDFIWLSGAHPDAIQFFTLGSTKPSTNIQILDNRYKRLTSQPVQGIFFSAEQAGIRYSNVTVKGNALSGTMWNAIAIDKADGVVIDENFEEGWNEPSTDPTKPNMKGAWIQTTNCTAVVSTNNVATAIQGGATGPTNTIIPAATPGDYSRMDAWWAAHHAGPVPTPTPTPDPTDWKAVAAALQQQLDAERAAETAEDAAQAAADAANAIVLADLNAQIKSRDTLYALLLADRDDDRVGMQQAIDVLTAKMGSKP